MIPRVPHEFSCKEFVRRSSLFTGEKQTKKSVKISHFNNLKFLFITVGVLNSARFDSKLIRFQGNLKLTFNRFPLGLRSSQISLAKMASEAQTAAKMEFLLGCG